MFAKYFLLLLAAGLLGVAAAETPAPRAWTPQQFGAAVDGRTLDTLAIQQAVDAAHAAGGGVVRFAPGVYLSGTIQLLSDVTLQLDAGSTLLGSPHVADYRRGNWPALILARGQQNVGIAGAGTIDGQGQALAADTLRLYSAGDYLAFFPGLEPGELVFTGIATDKHPWIDPHAMQRAGTLAARVAPRDREDVATWRVDEFVRPQLLEFWSCRGVRVSGVTLRDAANWVETYRECDDLEIRGIRVVSTTYWNNDGMDIVNCRGVVVEDCDIDAADDGICLKSDPSPTGRRCEDIAIRHCRIRSSASAFKLGTASHHGFRRIRVEDLTVYDTYRSAVALEAVDGGVLEDVTVSHVRARQTGNAFFLRVGQRNRDRPPGAVRRVVLSDFDVEVPAGKPDAGYPHEGPPLKFPVNVIPASIVGLPDRPVEEVTLRNIAIRYAGGGRPEVAQAPFDALGAIPERRENYPEYSMFGELPAWGLFLRDVRGVLLENVTMRAAAADYRPALVAHRVHDLSFGGTRFAGPPAAAPLVVLADVSAAGTGTIRYPADATKKLLVLPPGPAPAPAQP